MTCDVIRNDELDLEVLNNYDRIVLSPGPGLPNKTVNLLEVIQQADSKTPILGVCLGMQAIAVQFGGELVNQEDVKHGVQTKLTVTESSKLFDSVPNQFNVGLYHSWKVDENLLPSCLKITSLSSEGVIMSLEHRDYPIVGVQFHPESILSEYGKKIISNFLFASW